MTHPRIYRGAQAIAVARRQGLRVAVHVDGGTTEMTPDEAEGVDPRNLFVWAEYDPTLPDPDPIQRLARERPEELRALLEDETLSPEEIESRYDDLLASLGKRGKG